jgi:hypothetical protein
LKHSKRGCKIKDVKRKPSKPKLPKAALEFFKQAGAKGGKKGGSLGGKKAAENMTAGQRRERARKAVAAREAKRKKQAKP